jgi:hypothetical protein
MQNFAAKMAIISRTSHNILLAIGADRRNAMPRAPAEKNDQDYRRAESCFRTDNSEPYASKSRQEETKIIKQYPECEAWPFTMRKFRGARDLPLRWTPSFRPRSAENKRDFCGLLSIPVLFDCRSFFV